MNRDEELIRAILEMVGAEPSGRGIAFGKAETAKLQRSLDEIDEHLELAEQDRLIEIRSKPINGPIRVHRLTSRGHDFLARAWSTALLTLKEPEHITLAEGFTILQQNGLSAEDAKTRLRQAFVQKAFPQAPIFVFEYDEAEIDWTTGYVKIPRRKERFCPTFPRTDFDRYFFKESDASSSYSHMTERAPSRRVFIIHGHESEPRHAVSDFLRQIGFTPVILHQQSNLGRTIIEKFEAHAEEVDFAVVILTPDDVGGPKGCQQQPRARQNVILELGYFIGKLGRKNVCAIKHGELEIPSDIIGVAWTQFDEHDAWKIALAKELRDAGHAIDSDKVMGP